MILDGKATAAAIRAALREEIEKAKPRAGRAPRLAVILVGEDPASQVYVRNKEKACADAGIDTVTFRKPAAIQQAELEAFIAQLNADETIDGILLQLPLPAGLDAQPCIDAISPEKDVDGLTAVNQGRTAMNVPGLRPCTPAGVLALLDHYGISMRGKKVVVLGRSILVGRPIALMLGSRDYDATVTVCHSHTPDLASVCREADVIVAAMGRPRFVTADMVKTGAVIIDVGINRAEDGKLCGDVDYENVEPLASAITPVPGGIGPMTISQLLVNTTKAWKEKIAKAGDAAMSGSRGGNDVVDDPIYAEAVRFVMESGKVSISLLQRHFRIGFNRSARFVEQMEKDGILSPSDGTGPRSVVHR